ncbi:hypothetical protein OUZ56_009577 [Daphnia magna]|uniref:Uncharacterized protein n=1 Tax=Daphnia magna TaxID=35525 RepID=A0ABR0AGM7_9CRUS|nr:hypothetical protein OUZ56_009577 [Daphnia magna]
MKARSDIIRMYDGAVEGEHPIGIDIDLQHNIQKGYTYSIDNDVNIHRQLEHKLNCFGKQHYPAQALNAS